MPLSPVEAEREQDVAPAPEELAVAGVHVEHPTDRDRSSGVEGAAMSGLRVDGRDGSTGIEVPEDGQGLPRGNVPLCLIAAVGTVLCVERGAGRPQAVPPRFASFLRERASFTAHTRRCV